MSNEFKSVDDAIKYVSLLSQRSSKTGTSPSCARLVKLLIKSGELSDDGIIVSANEIARIRNIETGSRSVDLKSKAEIEREQKRKTDQLRRDRENAAGICDRKRDMIEQLRGALKKGYRKKFSDDLTMFEHIKELGTEEFCNRYVFS